MCSHFFIPTPPADQTEHDQGLKVGVELQQVIALGHIEAISDNSNRS